MPDITISVTIPEQHQARVSAATTATNKAELEAWVKAKIKAEVVQYEADQAKEAYLASAPDVEAEAEAAKAAAQQTAAAEVDI